MLTLAQVHALELLAVAGALLLALLALQLLQFRGRRRLTQRLAQAEAQLSKARTRDALTGLVSRPVFEQALDKAVAASDADRSALTLVYVGLDNFRALNDGYGHAVGDALLKQVARRLADSAEKPLSLSRLGGDEFALILALDLPEATQAADTMLAALRQPYECDGLSLSLEASMGLAAYPEHGSRPRLVGNAALAMQSVKRIGGGGHATYDPALAVDQREQAEMLQSLRSALRLGQLHLVYQPKVEARTLMITATEALLRWEHPQRGTISPSVFIPLAERHGLIGEIGRWVIEEACRQAAQWRAQGFRMRMAVNISGYQMRQDDFVEHLLGALARHAIPPGRLTCEITESVAMEDTAHTREAFDRLRRAGLHVSIDDFGTGHSSLASLRRLPAAELKVDRAFVTDLGQSERAHSIVQAIVQMARSLGLRVVAEGVETELQRDALVALGCDEMQGYLFARPMSATALALWADKDQGPEGDADAFSPSLFLPTMPAALD